jgi:serine/threonine-protein kinase
MQPSPRLDELPAALALEVDALCDDFERHWRRSRRRGTPGPHVEEFVARAPLPARAVLRQCLDDLERELCIGVELPDLPGLVLEAEIGRGGMGVVYLARRKVDSRPVALKLIPGAEHARWSRWLAELADLRHPHLVPLEGFGTHNGLHFVVMPLVAGGDLEERFGEFAVCPAQEIAGLMAKVAGAVDFLHGRGILHRDLKPSNILLATAGGREPLVCDFGLAGRLGEAGGSPSRVVGTPAYMAPEQREGRPLTPAADVWSLGAVLYELLTGWAPGRAPGQVADLVPPRVINGLVDEALERICVRCLAPAATDRYGSAADLAEELNRYQEHT